MEVTILGRERDKSGVGGNGDTFFRLYQPKLEVKGEGDIIN